MRKNVKPTKDRTANCFVVDVGMNDGFYTNMAGILGCKVYAFELQRRCITISKIAIHKNNIKDKVTIFNHPASSTHGEEINIAMPEKELCDGGFTFSGPSKQERTHANLPLSRNVSFTTIALDDLIPTTVRVIDMLKIDVEGHEIDVLKGSLNLFGRGVVKVAVVEIGALSYYDSDSFFGTFAKLFSFGYTAVTLNCQKDKTGKRRDDAFDNSNFDSFKVYIGQQVDHVLRCPDLKLEKLKK